MATTAVSSPCMRPWVSAKFSLHGAVHGADDGIGDAGEGFARRARRHRAGQDAHADQEHVFEPEHADAFEQVFVVARLRKRGFEAAAKFLAIRQRAEELRIDQRVHDLRIARQNVGQPRRQCQHQRDQRDQHRDLPQQRQKPRRAAQIAEEMVEQH